METTHVWQVTGMATAWSHASSSILVGGAKMVVLAKALSRVLEIRSIGDCERVVAGRVRVWDCRLAAWNCLSLDCVHGRQGGPGSEWLD